MIAVNSQDSYYIQFYREHSIAGACEHPPSLRWQIYAWEVILVSQGQAPPVHYYLPVVTYGHDCAPIQMFESELSSDSYHLQTEVAPVGRLNSWRQMVSEALRNRALRMVMFVGLGQESRTDVGAYVKNKTLMVKGRELGPHLAEITKQILQDSLDAWNLKGDGTKGGMEKSF